MQLSTRIIFLLIFIATQSACSFQGDNKSNPTSNLASIQNSYDVDYEAISKLLKNQATAGPNCVSAALMGRGVIGVPFNILPSDMSQHAFEKCFIKVDTIQEGDIVALHSGDVIFHVFLKVALSPGVFSKASASKSSPYELISMEDAGNCLDSDGKIKAYCTSYRLNVTSECPLSAFSAFIKNTPQDSVASRSGLFLKKVFGLIESTPPEVNKEEILNELENLDHTPLLVDSYGMPSEEKTGINVTFLYREMLNNARSWVNRK